MNTPFHLLLVLTEIVVLICVFGAFSPQNNPETTLEREKELPWAEWPIIQSNSLASMSYLPCKPEVLAMLISEEGYNGEYCSIEYLSNLWPTDLVKNASKICFCESTEDPNRVNDRGEYSVGLFQVNIKAHPEYSEKELKNPINNVLAAIKIYWKEGWGAWYNCSKSVGIIN